MHNADQVIAYIDQGGLTLPDRDYYMKEDNPKMKEMRQHLVEYATQLFTLAGQTPQQAGRIGADGACALRPRWPRLRWTARSAASRRIAITR